MTALFLIELKNTRWLLDSLDWWGFNASQTIKCECLLVQLNKGRVSNTTKLTLNLDIVCTPNTILDR